MFDEGNCRLLGKLMNIDVWGRDYRREYDELVKPTLRTWSNGKPFDERLCFGQQTGGRLYTLSTEKEKIDIEVEELTSVSEDDRGKKVEHKIIFFFFFFSSQICRRVSSEGKTFFEVLCIGEDFCRRKDG
jgi:hypothetical protein